MRTRHDAEIGLRHDVKGLQRRADDLGRAGCHRIAIVTRSAGRLEAKRDFRRFFQILFAMASGQQQRDRIRGLPQQLDLADGHGAAAGVTDDAIPVLRVRLEIGQRAAQGGRAVLVHLAGEIEAIAETVLPVEVKADTSTEIALNLVASPNREALTNGIDLVTNNHFDTDGTLSVWTVLTGERALSYRDLLIAAAEAGDFSEHSSDDGVRASIATR